MTSNRLPHIAVLFAIITCLIATNASGQDLPANSDIDLLSNSAGTVPHDPTTFLSQEGMVWVIERIESDGVGNYSSIALDSDGWPHISYYDFTNGDLKYAYKDDSGWHTQTVNSFGNVGGYTSLALDSLDRPHISYCKLLTESTTECDDLRYVWYDGAFWHIATPDSAGNVGGYTSLALAGDRPHISYYDHTNKDLKFYYIDSGGTPYSYKLDGTGTDVGLYSSLALDVDRRHISYMDNTNKHLKYVLFDGSNWYVETRDSTANTGYYSSIDVCQTYYPGAPRIMYYSNGELKYAHKFLFGGWTYAVFGTDPPGPTSIALDSNCQVHVSYFELYNGELIYGNNTSGWETEVVDSDGDVWPYWTSLALDDDDLPHISYYDDSHFGLSYAHKAYPTYLPILLSN